MEIFTLPSITFPLPFLFFFSLYFSLSLSLSLSLLGLLLNELMVSPFELVASVIKLIKLSLSLDTGSYFASQSDIILYILRYNYK